MGIVVGILRRFKFWKTSKKNVLLVLIILLWVVITGITLLYIDTLRGSERGKLTYDMAVNMSKDEILEFISQREMKTPGELVDIVIPLISIGGFGLGIVAFWLSCTREEKINRKMVIESLLLPLKDEEREVMEKLIDGGFTLPQATLRVMTGYGKMKIKRVVERLEEKGLVETSKIGGRVMVSLSRTVRSLLEI